MAALAKLADVKKRLKSVSADSDALLLQMLSFATGVAEHLIGAEPGGLRRQQDIVEYPWDTPCESEILRLARKPLESVASVKQLYAPGTDSDFAYFDALVDGEDYIVDDDGAAAKLLRIDDVWQLRKRWLRVQYTAGWVDPARIEVALTAATWTAATRTLHQAGAFAGYTFAAGDCTVITGGTGAAKGIYTIASKTDADNIVLSTSLAAGNLAAADITSGYAGMILPPEILQNGIIEQVIWDFLSATTAGVKDFGTGAVGGHSDASQAGIHPKLQDAAAALRRRWF